MTAVCWVDLGVRDPDHAASFYGQLFGWTVAAPDETGYRLASRGGNLVAAFGPAEDPGVPYWTVYVRTTDIAASVDAIAAAGGAVVVPPTPAGDAGVSAVVRDPYGVPLSLWQPGTHDGTGAVAGVQLRLDAPRGQSAFLRAALGWQVRPDGTITYHDRTVATWVSVARRASPWLVSFAVDDRTAAVERAVALGASRDPDRPDVLVDPTGATFAVS